MVVIYKKHEIGRGRFSTNEPYTCVEKSSIIEKIVVLYSQ